jgi:rhodanese-related sulfurtransferase
MISNSSWYLYSGIAAGLYTIFAGFQYYTYSGMGLITSKQAKKLIKKNEIKHIIDVRTDMEWDMGHYSKAKHIPVSELRENNKIIKNISMNDGILVYCNTGQRARRAAETLRSFGFKNVYYISNSYKTL